MFECNCKCNNCDNDPYYGSYYCKHGKTGDLEAKGYCVFTGFIPSHSWLITPKIEVKDFRLMTEAQIEVLALRAESIAEAYRAYLRYRSYEPGISLDK